MQRVAHQAPEFGTAVEIGDLIGWRASAVQFCHQVPIIQLRHTINDACAYAYSVNDHGGRFPFRDSLNDLSS